MSALTNAGTVGDLLRENPQWPGEGIARTVAPLELPHIEGMGEWPGEGIFFNMPESIYHSIFAFSASLCKDMIVSPMIAWAKSPLNPKREDTDGPFKLLGRAYHARICEGREAYEARFATALDKADYPNALHTMEEIRRVLDQEGVEYKKSDAKPMLIQRLLAYDPDAQVWDQLVDDHADSIGTRDLITADAHDRIEIAARMIEADPQLCKAFNGGHAEVSLFYVDRETGVPCKARIDYLRLEGFTDLKSFSLKVERPVERAIIHEIANRKHYVPAAHYSDAIAAVKAMVDGDGEFESDGDDEQIAWARRWAKVTDEPEAMYVFQATGVAPITRGKVLSRENLGMFGVTQRRVQEMRQAFATNVEVYGAEPWLDIAPVETIDDSDFPIWASEI